MEKNEGFELLQDIDNKGKGLTGSNLHYLHKVQNMEEVKQAAYEAASRWTNNEVSDEVLVKVEDIVEFSNKLLETRNVKELRHLILYMQGFIYLYEKLLK